MVKPLSFKGDKKIHKKRKHVKLEEGEAEDENAPASSALTTVTQAATSNSNVAADEDDSWVTADAPNDIAGPVIVVLPSTPPTCIACDANGKVFAQEIENMIEDDPTTSEPHDVRQVWVANRVAGTEFLSLKGHHGRYLTADKFGILSSTREAISPEEQFLPILTLSTPSTFSLQTQRETFLSLSQPPPLTGTTTTTPSKPSTIDVRADESSITSNSTFRIRMQARFKPKLRASREKTASRKISRKEIEEAVGRRLDDGEVRRLKRARREGDWHEAVLDVRVKGKHDKFAS